MGDLVAVMQLGGRLEQFDTPDRILAAPASEFVARFVGADRGLKRLSLTRVRDLPLRRAVTAHPGDDAGEARRRTLADHFPYLLLVDEREQPIGWLDQDDLPTDGPLAASADVPTSPLFGLETTVKDALSMLIDAAVQAGIVVDREGRVLGIVTTEDIGAGMREGMNQGVGEAGARAVVGSA
jgi:osmoprotectant transport system ATP-binding protein